ncbi:MAG: hypothetical protein JRG72_04050 [Deltaproteobacteria bacterium]|nr:hypothetical protein [Deltaproteobacteria bacterium]MBW2134395.1 hypothetical protein [Deltaproteobacteria bacterium]
MLKSYRGQQKGSLAKIWLAIGLVSWCLTGCTYPSYVERDYGCSVETNKVNQFVYPEAGLYEATASVGLSPRAGVNVNEKYTKSFIEEPKAERAPYFGILEESD